jgi:hypothetical protein
LLLGSNVIMVLMELMQDDIALNIF